MGHSNRHRNGYPGSNGVAAALPTLDEAPESWDAPVEAPSATDLPEPAPVPRHVISARLPVSLKVVGVGGAGGNAISRMLAGGLGGVELLAINTDAQALHSCAAHRCLEIGKGATRGLGAGADPEMGRAAVEENREEIRAALLGADMVFITRGMGGGTGTGAAPVVAEIAQEIGALTVAVVTRPFGFEGGRRMRSAEAGVCQIRDRVDALITISNDRLVCSTERYTSISEAFRMADDVLLAAVQGISDIITVQGVVNVDFADVKTILHKSGPAIIGIGRSSGDDRALEAARAAVSSPLLDGTFEGARGILLNICGGPDLSLHEVDAAARVVAECAGADANIIYGVVVDDRIGTDAEVTVTVVASGFDRPLAAEGPVVIPLAVPAPEAVSYEVPAFLRKRSESV